MHSREFKKIYHPRLGRYVYEHRGNGLIVDNLFKPLGRKAKKVVQPFLKAKAKEGLSKAGEKLGKRAVQMTSERAGDLIRKRLNGTSNGSSKGRQGRKANVTGRRQEAQDVNALINNLIAMS